MRTTPRSCSPGGGDEISAEDAEEYSQRIYATNNGGREGELEFPIWGVPLVCARYGEGEESYVAGTSSPCLEGGSFNMKYADELESCTLSGTIYCPAGENVQAYCNPVYQQADGRLYLTSGQGMSSDGAGTMSFTLSNETAGPEGERGWAVDITLDITPKYPTERVCVLLYGEDGELLGREEFAPEARSRRRYRPGTPPTPSSRTTRGTTAARKPWSGCSSSPARASSSAPCPRAPPSTSCGAWSFPETEKSRPGLDRAGLLGVD